MPIKREMIEWWGPIINEYYAGSEGIGMTLIKARGLARPIPAASASAIHGKLHVCGPEGEELPAGQDGLIYFENDQIPTYHNDPAKTAEAMHPRGWMTLGDIGHLDEDGYLYLTDRKSHMIISGGVNIYPQEIENLLVTHPKVMDAAVIGAPCPDLGEQVVAVVQPRDMAEVAKDDGRALGSGTARLPRPQPGPDQDAQAVRLPPRSAARGQWQALQARTARRICREGRHRDGAGMMATQERPTLDPRDRPAGDRSGKLCRSGTGCSTPSTGCASDMPVAWVESQDDHVHPPFWLVTRYDDVMRISKDNATFLNNPRTGRLQPYRGHRIRQAR